MSAAIKLSLAIAAFILLILAVTFVSGSMSIITAPFRGEVEKNERIEADGDYRIAAYDQFYDMCTDAQSLQGQIENQEGQIASTSDPEVKERLQMGKLGMEQQLESVVNKYNNQSQQDYTKGQFKDSNLPYELDTEQEIECGS